MKILLIHPPDSKVSIAPGRFEPLALEVLAATLPGHDVRILDMRFETTSALDRYISRFRPALAGITVNNTIHVNPAYRLLDHIRERYPEIRLVVGGHHPTMLPGDFHRRSVDAIFFGWAEKTFPGYVAAMENGASPDSIPGLEILEKGVPVMTNRAHWDLKADEIPWPRRELVTRYRNRYRSDMGFRTSLVNTTRGCPNRCTFCGVWQVTGGVFLTRPPEDVFREIAGLPEQIHRVFFADDNTFIIPENAERLCRMLREAKIRKRYSGYCRSDTIIRHPELMREWKEIGLDNLCVGFEGTDNNRLGELNKRNSSSNNEEAARILNGLGIPFRPHFLIEPSFEKEDFRRICRYVKTHRLKSPIFPILTPIPGTKYYFEVKDQINLGYDYFDFAHATFPTRLSQKEFYRSWIRMYLVSYPFLRNLGHWFLRSLARLSGNRVLAEKHAHLRIINLLMIRFFGIFLYFKLVKHYREMEKRKGDVQHFPKSATFAS